MVPRSPCGDLWRLVFGKLIQTGVLGTSQEPSNYKDAQEDNPYLMVEIQAGGRGERIWCLNFLDYSSGV